jgi:predicted dehydrogenase
MNEQSTSRRELLTAACGFAAAAALPNIAHSQSQPTKKAGYALVGLGRLTLLQLLPAFAQCQHSRPVALVSGHPEKAQKTAAQYHIDPKNIYNYENFDTLKDNPEVDIIYVVLPNGMHAEYTIRAAQAGKHVLCEKPMANTVDECNQMIDACKKAQRKLMIGYRLRHEPYNLAAIDICRTKKYGAVKTITADHAFNIRTMEWRLDKKLAGGGPMVDLGIYCLNASRYLTGEEPAEVMATMVQPKDDPRFKEVESSITFELKFPSQIIASCTTAYDHAGTSRYSIFTEHAAIDLDGSFAYGGLSMKIRAAGKTETPSLPQINQFAAEMDHFSQCVLEDKPPITPGEEGLADMKAIAAIYESATSGKRVTLA